MALVGCFVCPHPPIIVPEVGTTRLLEADATVQAMRIVQERAAVLAPDTIVLLSPHAPIAFDRMGVSLASLYHGSLAFFGAPNVRVEAAGDEALAEAVIQRAEQAGLPAAITASRGEAVDLDHGAIVPLVYLFGGLMNPCRLVLLSFSQLSLQEHVRFGAVVGAVLQESPQRVVYVASADLSHRLVPGAPVGFDPRGIQFDRRVVDTFAAGDWKALVSIDPGLARAAGECGYRSLAVLSGVVGAMKADGVKTGNRALSYEGPFGVGYLVGEVEIQQTSGNQGTAQ